MKLFLIIIAVVILLLCFVLFVPQTIKISLNNGKIKIWFSKIKVFDSTKKKREKKKEKSNFVKIPTIKGVVNIVKSSIDVYFKEKDEVVFILKELVDNAILTKCKIAINFGTGNAALTGMAYGFGWNLITFIYSTVLKLDQKENVSIAFTADYENLVFDNNIELTLKVKVFKDLLLLIRAYKVYKRIKAKFI